MLIYNNRLLKLFVNISQLTITTPPIINIADTITPCVRARISLTKIYIQMEYCLQESPILHNVNLK